MERAMMESFTWELRKDMELLGLAMEGGIKAFGKVGDLKKKFNKILKY